MKRYFIVGTDTDCGKTYATCQLFRFLQGNTKQVLAIKPVVSGCTLEHDALMNEDIRLLRQCNESFAGEISPWRFTPPVSPHLAAKEAGVNLSSNMIADFCLDPQFKAWDYVLIEGAGGLMVPLNDHETWVDFLQCSAIPVIFVVGMRLGCLNHALLTAAVLKMHGIACAGWIANFIDPDMLLPLDNLQTLVDRLEYPLLGTIPYQGDFQADTKQCYELFI